MIGPFKIILLHVLHNFFIRLTIESSKVFW